MDKSQKQEQPQKSGVSFENLKLLSQFSAPELSKMNKDIKRVITQVDSFAKSVRDRLRDMVSKESAKQATASIAAEPPKPVVAQATPSVAPQIEATEKREFKDTRPVRSTGTQQTGQGYSRENNAPRGQFNRSNQGEGQYNRPNQTNGQFSRSGQGAGQYSRPNQQGGQYNRPNQTGGQYNRQAQGTGQYNRDSSSAGRPPFGQRSNTGFAGGAKPAFGAKADKPTERFPVTQKKVFDSNQNKRKDYDKFGKEDKFNKRNQMRKGLAEEHNIEERIMGSRKIRIKRAKDLPQVQTTIDKAVITSETITVKQLAEKIGKPVSEILKKLMLVGVVSNINTTIDFATCELVASELGVALELKVEKSYEEKLADQFAGKKKVKGGASEKRAPIVTVLGHVDHGKTSLLDYIRKANVAAGESGGITQHIGAYQIERKSQKITFIDTPGHAAFSAMRARGASVTDIAILVIAADDGIKPQTKEAIKHIQDAKVPMIVAVNKMDKPDANLERIKTQLTEEGILPEEWGGDAIIVPISATTGLGIDKLIEMIMLVAEMQELSANQKEKALGMVIEAKLDKGKGPVATVIILNGTLRVGDTIISGLAVGKVRAMLDDTGKPIKTALPSTPVSVLGLDQVPSAGDTLYAADESMSKKVLQERMRKVQTDKIAPKAAFSIEDFLAKSADSEKKVLNIIVKADVQGSFEALTLMLNEVQNSEVRVECIHGGVGAISESDINMAKSSGAILIGFNVRPDANAASIAEQSKVKIYQYRIIYEALDEVARIIKGMRTPVFAERILGHATVIRLFKISRIGTVAGCIVNDGKITKNSNIRLIRGKDTIADTTITTLQREKNDVKEVLSGFDMGIKLEKHNDILLDDRLEAYIMERVEQD